MKLSEKIKANRAAIVEIVESNNTLYPRIILDDLNFDLGENHLDILVDRTSEYSPGDLGEIQHQLEKLLGVSIDVITPNLLRDEFRDKILASALVI